MKTSTRRRNQQDKSDDAASHSDSGLTLVELLIAAGLFSIVAVMVFQLINNFQATSVSVTTRAKATSDAMVALNRMARDVRNAVVVGSTSPIILAAPNQLTLITTDGSASSNVIEATFSVSATPCPCTLTETSALYDTTSSTTTTPVIQRLVVQNLTTDQIFTYYPPSSSTAVSSTSTTYALPTTISVPTTGVSSPSIGSIESIGITLTIQPLANQPTATVSNIIEMRNVASAGG